ncbi:MAG: hypothetical protein QOF62_2820 [Pyrinomonadaceae bacterium]|jgi:hypothetical protein|nr:hypothetical protein [Pyrinomonadaceae bacterium]
MNISKEQSAQIIKRIEGFIAETSPDPLKLREFAAAEKVLPLIWDWGGVFTITPNGEIISFPFSLAANDKIVAFPLDESEEPRVESDLRLRNNALFGGSKKYHELKELIVKPDNAQVCPHCGGTGRESYAEKYNIDGIVCYCGGLGWIP